jgi:hypothetical protein
VKTPNTIKFILARSPRNLASISSPNLFLSLQNEVRARGVPSIPASPPHGRTHRLSLSPFHHPWLNPNPKPLAGIARTLPRLHQWRSSAEAKTRGPRSLPPARNGGRIPAVLSSPRGFRSPLPSSNFPPLELPRTGRSCEPPPYRHPRPD